jgi:hypothetical protein
LTLGKAFTPRASEFGQQLLPADLTFLASTTGGVIGGSVIYDSGLNNLQLVVDPATGEAALTNPSRFSVSIDGYEIRSAQGAVQPTGWVSLEEQLASAGWIEISTPTAKVLAELNAVGSTELLSGDVLQLGEIFTVSGTQDVELDFSILDGAVTDGLVRYGQLPRVGVNNLVLAVDPDFGHAVLVNSTGESIEIDGYEIRSSSGSLVTVNWQSLQENPDFAAWEEIGSSSATLLAELQPDGSTMLGNGELVWLGALFDVAAEQDLQFEFSMADGTVAAGPVLYRALPELEQPGDYNGDDAVTGIDFLFWQRGETPHPLSASDLAHWEVNYGIGVPGVGVSGLGGSTTVPEPSSAVLGLILVSGVHIECLRKRERGSSFRRRL